MIGGYGGCYTGQMDNINYYDLFKYWKLSGASFVFSPLSASSVEWFFEIKFVIKIRSIILFILGGHFRGVNVEVVECYNEVTNKWENVARTKEWIDEVIVSYQPFIPDIYVNFPL